MCLRLYAGAGRSDKSNRRAPAPLSSTWHNLQVPPAHDGGQSLPRRLQVVLFSGGRGSGALTRELIASPAIDLTLAINGYDDGASTGEVRRFLGDSLGPSDFRKNASALASTLRTCPPALIELLDLRFPTGYASTDALAAIGFISGDPEEASSDTFRATISRIIAALEYSRRARVGARLLRFADELKASGRAFSFSDCSLGNLVFAGAFLLADRDFNQAVDDYCALVGLPPGVIENVTDGTNAFLVAIDADGRLLATEEAIVDAARPNRIREIYLIDRPLTSSEVGIVGQGGAAADAILREREPVLAINPRLAPKIAAADLIIYAPGTQHSSLFPSYLTPELPDVIAGNLSALKVLVTNIQADAEITGSNAVDLVQRAAYYLTNKGRSRVPIPFLVTHSLINDPAHPEAESPYVPLGPTEAIEDPRLVRIGNFEDGGSGRHDAARVLGPFIASIAGRGARTRVAVILHDADSTNKIAQTLLEMIRGGLAGVPVEVTVFYPGPDALDPHLAARLPFAVYHLPQGVGSFADIARPGGFDYVLLFESSGMYRGEETVPLLAQLATGRLDAVWGSRRLSVRDIEESYRFRYQRNAVAGAVSYLGSYVLSLACLMLYGRYITDTLSGVRAMRAGDALDPRVDLTGRSLNHVLLASLLRRKAEILELPVRFFPLSPDRVKRTRAVDGLHALGILIAHRLAPARQPSRPQDYAGDASAPLRPAK
jgi:2-phospho-L-lactate transferase/gluconeogenesis factor (CofD/UPF0052 family)